MAYKHFGVMLDCSRNGVMNVLTVKKMIDYISLMGYNVLELYTEDTYKVSNEEYFGYLRGGYTKAEIQEIDEYAKTKGIELIPCVQALAHFDALVRLPHYQDIVDVNDILLVDEPKTYQLIEHIFDTLEENFTSRKVNIGMDEAHLLGLGKFLDKHGYQNRFDIILRHLNRVYDIAQRHGFTVHMWSDMFFRLLNCGDYYGENTNMTQEVIDKMPENIQLVYWDYYRDKPELYDCMLDAHKKTGKEVWFAGGAWSWVGFAPFNRKALHNGEVAMREMRKYNVENILLTVWGDDGKECSFFSLLPTMYAFRQFGEGNFDMEKIKVGFHKLLGLDFDSFMTLDKLNDTKRNEEFDIENPCKSLLYSDCFYSVIDYEYEKADKIDYGEVARKVEAAKAGAGEFGYIFDWLAALAKTMEIKAELGIRTRKAYKEDDKAALQEILKDYEGAGMRLQLFYKQFKSLWFKENKPNGWEIQDIRLGGLEKRLQSCKERIVEYLEGKISSVPELEEEILSYSGDLFRYAYKAIVSTNNL